MKLQLEIELTENADPEEVRWLVDHELHTYSRAQLRWTWRQVGGNEPE